MSTNTNIISLSSKVIADLESHFAEHELQDIRIYLAPAQNGQKLGIILDFAQENDEIFETDGYRFCFQKGLLEKCGGIDIELDDFGYVLKTKKPLALTNTGCNISSCSSCPSGCKM